MAILTIAHHEKYVPTDTILYIQDREKTIANHDTHKVLRHIMGHCVEDIVAVGYNGCSGIREVAAEQFRHSAATYHAIYPPRDISVTHITVEQYLHSTRRKRLPKRIKPDANGIITVIKTETYAEHLVISPHKTDRVSSATLQEIISKLMAHPYLRNYYALSAIHSNTDEIHAHILICNYAKDGSRKLCLSGSKLREFRRHLDHICCEYGISIIDTHEARLDPAHSAWIDQVITEDEIKVWPENHGSFTRGGRDQSASWMAAQSQRIKQHVDDILADPRLPPAYADLLLAQIEQGAMAYYPPYIIRPISVPELEAAILAQGGKARRDLLRVRQKEYYAVRMRIRANGKYRTRTLIESIIYLAYIIFSRHTTFLTTYYPATAEQLCAAFGPVDQVLQAQMDAIAFAREYNVRTPPQLHQRVDEINRTIAEVDQAIRADETLLSDKDLLSALRIWHSHVGPEELAQRARDYLSARGYTTYAQRDALLREVYRCPKRLERNREYLERLQANLQRGHQAIDTINQVSVMVETSDRCVQEACKRKPDLDTQLLRADQTRKQQPKYHHKNAERCVTGR